MKFFKILAYVRFAIGKAVVGSYYKNVLYES